MSQNQAEAEAAKRYRFRERMLFQTSRIWTFRVFINRRVLIDCRYSKYDVLTTDRQTNRNLWRRRAELIAWRVHIDCCFSSFHAICFRIAVCNRFISWCWLQKCKESKKTTFLMIIVAISLSAIEASRNAKTDETKRSVTQIFCLKFWMIVCWFDDLMMRLLCVISIFLFNKRCLNA